MKGDQYLENYMLARRCDFGVEEKAGRIFSPKFPSITDLCTVSAGRLRKSQSYSHLFLLVHNL